jgi:RNA polymerase sigma-70 factor (ECF subfamily)
MSNPVEAEQAAGPAVEAADIEDLARRFQNGDVRAFDDLVLACQSRMFNLAYRMLNNYDDAAELTQDIFVKVYKSIGKFSGRSKFSTWLYALALNTGRNRIRRNRRISRFEAFSMDDTPSVEDDERGYQAAATDRGPDSNASANETMTLVQMSIAELPGDFRAVAVMRDMQGMSYEEIAEAVGCSLGTVKSRISRARAMVRARLQQAGVTA